MFSLYVERNKKRTVQLIKKSINTFCSFNRGFAPDFPAVRRRQMKTFFKSKELASPL